MTLFQRIGSLFGFTPTVPNPARSPTASGATAAMDSPVVPVYTQPSPDTSPLPTLSASPLPTWLTDQDSLRDEGTLFGLSMARPDGKLAQIRAYFSQQSVDLDSQIEQYTEQLGAIDVLLDQRSNQRSALDDQISDLYRQQPAAHGFVQHTVGLTVWVAMSIGIFYLIDTTLEPILPNRWIAVSVFLAGMFGSYERTSFGREATRPTNRQFIMEMILPLTAALFVLAWALPTQAIGQAVSLCTLLFASFWLAGRLFWATVAALQADLTARAANQQLVLVKAQRLPLWQAERIQLNQEMAALQAQKWPLLTTLHRAQTEQNRLSAQRETLLHLFLSEFELARGLRDRLTDQQRKQLLPYEVETNPYS